MRTHLLLFMTLLIINYMCVSGARRRRSISLGMYFQLPGSLCPSAGADTLQLFHQIFERSIRGVCHPTLRMHHLTAQLKCIFSPRKEPSALSSYCCFMLLCRLTKQRAHLICLCMHAYTLRAVCVYALYRACMLRMVSSLVSSNNKSLLSPDVPSKACALRASFCCFL